MNVANEITKARNSYYSALKEAGAMTPEEVNLRKVKSLVSRAYRAAKRFNELKERTVSRNFFTKIIEAVFGKIGISRNTQGWLFREICRGAQKNSLATRSRNKPVSKNSKKTPSPQRNLWVSPSESLTQGTLFPLTSFRNTKHLSQERPLSREECAQALRKFRKAFLS